MSDQRDPRASGCGRRGGNARHGHDGGDELSRRSAVADPTSRRCSPAPSERTTIRIRMVRSICSTPCASRRRRASARARCYGGFNGQIHAARDVTKVHASAVETFQSYEHGALGEVDGDRWSIHRRPNSAPHVQRSNGSRSAWSCSGLRSESICARCEAADRAAASPGSSSKRSAEATVPRGLTALVRMQGAKSIPVLITSRCPRAECNRSTEAAAVGVTWPMPAAFSRAI